MPGRPGTSASTTSSQAASQAGSQGGRSAGGGGGSAASRASGGGDVILQDKGGEYYARKALLFTGPDNLRNHRVKAVPNMQFVGEGERSKENTSAISYMFRPPPDTPFPLAKNGRIGEIGWNSTKLNAPAQ